MKKARLIAMILALTMLSAVLSGCGIVKIIPKGQ